MSCPDLYLGPSYDQAPPAPFWTNPAIAPATTSMTVGTGVTIHVTARNHGTDVAPPTLIELFWSDPTTGFPAVASRLIGDYTFQVANVPPDAIPGATSIPPADGEATVPFGWTPTAEAAGTNDGHVCLLARLSMSTPPAGGCAQQIYSNSPATDSRSAIRNIHVYAAKAKPDTDANAPMGFAFAVTNTLQHLADTRLAVRALDPKVAAHRQRLKLIVADRAVHDALAQRSLRFALPNALLVGQGRERVQLPVAALAGDGRVVKTSLPRLQRTGPLPAALLGHLLNPGTKLTEPKARAAEVNLLPGEVQQAIVQIAPTRAENAVYAIEVEHRGADDSPIGGLTILFVPPHLGWDRALDREPLARAPTADSKSLLRRPKGRRA